VDYADDGHDQTRIVAASMGDRLLYTAIGQRGL